MGGRAEKPPDCVRGARPQNPPTQWAGFRGVMSCGEFPDTLSQSANSFNNTSAAHFAAFPTTFGQSPSAPFLTS